MNAAYAAFEKGGVDAVRIDPLAKALGITRGSFYWHFKDRRALLQAVVDRWDQLQTEETIKANEVEAGSACERLLRLLRTCASDDGRFEIEVRAWASTDDAARRSVAQVDERRIGYMVSLLTEAGVPEGSAISRARVGYLAWLGGYTGSVSGSVEQRLHDMDCLHRMMLDKR